jgi:3-dehydroquinate synthase
MTSLRTSGNSHTIKVRLDRAPDRSYTILIRPGLLDDVPSMIAERWDGQKIFVITDANVGRRYGREFCHRLTREGAENFLLVVPAGEASKRAPTVQRLQTRLLSLGIRRKSVIVALGGGVVGDLAGFVAATILRGVDYVQIPTSLLAQVDSSVGGKVGIDHRLGKNLIGAFHQPSAVFVDPYVLRSLPVKEVRNGFAEMVKIAAALDRRLFEKLERAVKQFRRLNPDRVAPLVAEAAALKASVIKRDEFESGLRKSLNLGHTIGHAYEAASGYSLLHGYAVSIGLALESSIAERMGFLRSDDRARLEHLLMSLGLPVSPPRVNNHRKFFAALNADKKAERNRSRFVLLNGIGSCVIDVEVPSVVLRDILGMPA